MRGTIDIKEFSVFRQNANKFAKQVDIDEFCSSLAKEIAARLLAKAKRRTPVDSGELRKHWNVDADVTKEGLVYRIDVYNETEYAIYVEYGHRQKVGRYVPAIGKRLVKPWVNGVFMMTISAAELQIQSPKIVEKRLKEKLGEAFK